ncbi:hypothetical protein BDZ97DRAFT_1766999 [Flammula alnicola]|nr:hypothetical protein BDZ97DRAFT_1766999 [Flammula alnicola]
MEKAASWKSEKEQERRSEIQELLPVDLREAYGHQILDSLRKVLGHPLLNSLDDMTEDDNIDEDAAPKKRKMTYDREHRTENPKPPKHSRVEIQAAAAEKRAVTIAKKKELAGLHAAAELEQQQKRQKVLKEVAAIEEG